ncbi:MAG: bifunctional phosphoglucose/phosphomannose isomerase [Fimbriimonadales bacterium]|nr:bifunctional phosphoglucose/phosphomannose isomerase [Fimbriimonadales bacterium]
MDARLNDRGFVERMDPKGMLRLTEEFPNQCRRALEIARSSALPESVGDPKLVVLTGLGGSAAGGDFARALFEAQAKVPFVVNRDYALASFVGPDTLVFAASYSGNTEETLAAYDDARAKGAKIVVVTNGGKLAAKAQQVGVPCVIIPAGQPPRTALGYLLIPVVYACERFGLLPAQDYEAAFALLDQCRSDWTVEAADNPAKRLAAALHGKLGLLYGLGSWQAIVANRWKAQINENSKNMAFANAFPELNHNEILGWVGADRQGVASWVVALLQDGSESAKMQARARVTSELTSKVAEWHTVEARGGTLLQKMLSLTYFGDFVSLYLAALNGVDPENIDWINVLKSELAKVE